MPNIQSRLSRKQLADALGNDHEVIRTFEQLQESTTEVLPTTIEEIRAIAVAAGDFSGLKINRTPQNNPSVRGTDGINSSDDITGTVLSVDLVYLVNAIRAFLPKPVNSAVIAEDSSMILANRVFARR